MKNDALDAEAICEALTGASSRSRHHSSKAVMVIHRMREGFVAARTAIANRLRGLLAEFGVFLPQGIEAVRSRFTVALEEPRTK